ncbi:hypothetical protein PVAND_004595 [Polypedilum vanderplanki]|uniref:Monocarboxylate transporter n=1 Tax=Polypedilum vanderplanki TaxID=319348 RepID=A0A9J6BXF2_POLVA|nr:hypothetical protein PVAND_004595 [Polypedilum vanderplanki]
MHEFILFRIVVATFGRFDVNTRLIEEEEDSSCPTILEQDFNRFHHTIPGLRRSGVDANAIRQHYYPDGDWGWIVCSVAFLAHILTTGFQLSYGFLLLYAIKHLGQESALEAIYDSTLRTSQNIIFDFCSLNIRKGSRTGNSGNNLDAKMVQRESKVISSYKAPAFDINASKTQTGAYKKTSPFDIKEQDRKMMSTGGKNNNTQKQDPWGKTFKNESHFKSLHIC